MTDIEINVENLMNATSLGPDAWRRLGKIIETQRAALGKGERLILDFSTLQHITWDYSTNDTIARIASDDSIIVKTNSSDNGIDELKVYFKISSEAVSRGKLQKLILVTKEVRTSAYHTPRRVLTLDEKIQEALKEFVDSCKVEVGTITLSMKKLVNERLATFGITSLGNPKRVTRLAEIMNEELSKLILTDREQNKGVGQITCVVFDGRGVSLNEGSYTVLMENLDKLIKTGIRLDLLFDSAELMRDAHLKLVTKLNVIDNSPENKKRALAQIKKGTVGLLTLFQEPTKNSKERRDNDNYISPEMQASNEFYAGVDRIRAQWITIYRGVKGATQEAIFECFCLPDLEPVCDQQARNMDVIRPRGELVPVRIDEMGIEKTCTGYSYHFNRFDGNADTDTPTLKTFAKHDGNMNQESTRMEEVVFPEYIYRALKSHNIMFNSELLEQDAELFEEIYKCKMQEQQSEQ